ncbi:hypothetical protein GCM10010468_08530 [Actinocorallia longicatena]|uniref:Uncharacterized protein n=1 Tax=Actinocorallia longicatena TaxID=111803 RepID=A0ABP6Q4X1_9ACTN
MALDLGQDRVRQDLSGPVPEGGAEIVFGLLEHEVVLTSDHIEDLQAFGDDLGADAVTCDDCETDGT